MRWIVQTSSSHALASRRYRPYRLTQNLSASIAASHHGYPFLHNDTASQAHSFEISAQVVCRSLRSKLQPIICSLVANNSTCQRASLPDLTLFAAIEFHNSLYIGLVRKDAGSCV